MIENPQDIVDYLAWRKQMAQMDESAAADLYVQSMRNRQAQANVEAVLPRISREIESIDRRVATAVAAIGEHYEVMPDWAEQLETAANFLREIQSVLEQTEPEYDDDMTLSGDSRRTYHH